MEHSANSASSVKNEQSAYRKVLTMAKKAAAFIRKDMAIAVSYRLQFVFQFSQVFFAVAVIYFIDAMLSETGTPGSLKNYQADYFSFALVGLAVTSYLKAGLVTITNDIRQVMNQGTLEAMCATPVAYSCLLFYTALWPFIFETFRVISYFLIAALVFGTRFQNAQWTGAVLTMSLTLPIFLMLGVISSSILVLVKKGDPINWIFSSLAALLAGTMFPISVLPDWLRTIAYCLPLTHALEATRKCLLAGASVHQVRTHLIALLAFLLALFPLSLIINRFCMNKTKKQGAFTTH